MIGGWCGLWLGLALAQAQTSEPPKGVEVGVGLRNSLAEEGRIEGARLVGRYRRGGLSLEADLYGAAETQRHTTLDALLVEWAAAQGSAVRLPVSTDRATVSLLVGLHPWSIGGQGASPVLYLGAEARYQDRYVLLYPEDAVVSRAAGHRVLAGPLLGAGIEAELGPLGLRFAAYSRPHRDLSADDPAIEQDVTLHLDALLRLHARGSR